MSLHTKKPRQGKHEQDIIWLIMANPTLSQQLRTFLIDQHSVENFDFILVASTYILLTFSQGKPFTHSLICSNITFTLIFYTIGKKLDSTALKRGAAHLFQQYIQTNSEYKVNIARYPFFVCKKQLYI